MKRYKIKYSYVMASSPYSLIEKYGCYMGTTKPTESELISWAKYNTIGGGYDYKIINISDPY